MISYDELAKISSFAVNYDKNVVMCCEMYFCRKMAKYSPWESYYQACYKRNNIAISSALI
ncbi:hypothetical protein FHW36_10871 [Chitinophaga polysaccharea]|uniref:Uncharacterized protein n=1 Tax=Chitinophaga polysaccharea TaxID=1293035 RepID=A0A561PC63_9BACT|nr:hypothetical protein FHW36_10871 [Chitinophaga polysaccharea]